MSGKKHNDTPIVGRTWPDIVYAIGQRPLLVVMLSALIVAGIVFARIKWTNEAVEISFPISDQIANRSVWLGIWEHESKGKGGKTTGTLIISEKESGVIGEATMLYASGSEAGNDLYDIRFFENGRVMKGLWRNTVNQSVGQFEFILSDDKMSFHGCYSQTPNEVPDKKLFWNGTKKN